MVYSRPHGAISSAGERCLHTAEVAGSIPASPTLILELQPFESGLDMYPYRDLVAVDGALPDGATHGALLKRL